MDRMKLEIKDKIYKMHPTRDSVLHVYNDYNEFINKVKFLEGFKTIGGDNNENTTD